MQKLILSILFTAGLIISTFSQTDSVYHRAGKAYDTGNYEEALALYRQLNEQGLEAADLYYNMGNAAFRSNKLGFAILYYEKALKLDPRHEEAESNLEYVSMYREDQLESVPEFFLRSWFNSLVLLLPLKTWSILSITLFLILLSGILLYIFGQRLVFKKSGFTLAVASLIIFIISFSATMRRHHALVDPDKAIVVSPSVVVKSSPSQSGNELFILHEGTRVSTDEEVGEWVEIKISDGRIGWIPVNTLKMI